MSEHRVPVLGDSLRRYVDPARSRDPRVREIVARLATLDVAPPPPAHFRAELRAQLVAVAPRLVAEGTAEETRRTPSATRVPAAGARRATTAGRVLSRLGTVRLGRPVAITAAAMAVLLFLMSGAVWISNKALPGDNLYALKRASENIQYSLTSGDGARGQELLGFAKTRADEVSALLAQASATAEGAGPSAATGINARTASLITTTLGSADDDVRQAAQMLGDQAVRDHSADPLKTMTAWAPGQAARLQDIVNRIPAGSLRDRAATSAQLVDAASARARTLQGEIGCNCLDTSGSDALGPVPCSVCGQSPAGGSGAQPSGRTPTATVPGPSGAAPNGGSTLPGVPGLPGPVTLPGTSGTVPGPGTGTLPVPLPTKPGILPSVPLPVPSVSVGTCGLGVTLGGLGLGLGTCGVHVKI